LIGEFFYRSEARGVAISSAWLVGGYALASAHYPATAEQIVEQHYRRDSEERVNE
jgi:hypothetical protein